MFKQINMKMLYLLEMAIVHNHAEESMQLCSTLIPLLLHSLFFLLFFSLIVSFSLANPLKLQAIDLLCIQQVLLLQKKRVQTMHIYV
jgi:hypothetical protein